MNIQEAFNSGNRAVLRHHVQEYKKIDTKKLEQILDDTIKGGIISTALFEKSKDISYLTSTRYGGLAAEYTIKNGLTFKQKQMHYACFREEQRPCTFKELSGHNIVCYSKSLARSVWEDESGKNTEFHDLSCQGSLWRDGSGKSVIFNGRSAHYLRAYDNALHYSLWKDDSAAVAELNNKAVQHARMLGHSFTMSHWNNQSGAYSKCQDHCLFMARLNDETFKQTTFENEAFCFGHAEGNSLEQSYFHGIAGTGTSLSTQAEQHSFFNK